MGAIPGTHLLSSLLCLLGPLLNLRGVLGFWINSTTNLQSSISADFALNQDFYALLQETLLKQGQTRVIFSSTKPSTDAPWRKPVISPDLAWQRATDRKWSRTAPENPTTHNRNPWISNHTYKKLLDSISDFEIITSAPHKFTKSGVDFTEESFTEFRPVKSILSFFRSVAGRDEGGAANEIPEEAGDNEEDFSNALETVVTREEAGGASVAVGLNTWPGKTRHGTPGDLASAELSPGDLSPGELSRNELSRDDLTRDELTGDELSRNELSRGELSRGEMSRRQMSPGEASRADLSGGDLSPGDLDRGKRREDGSSRGWRQEEAFDGLYRDLCRSRSSFQLLSTAVNDALDEVQVLPNTWVWVTKCLRNNSPCPSIAAGVVAKCKQKKSWVNAFARINQNDPWRWHWIAVDTSCSCGVLDLGLG